MYDQKSVFNRFYIGVLILALIAFAIWFLRKAPAQVPDKKIAIMSSIPLQWGEADMAVITKGEAKPAVFFAGVQKLGKVTMLDQPDMLPKLGPDVLIMVQPRALSPRELVDLDAWVRGGGRAIIFADPALQWESSYPLGDNRRPLFTSFLSPLLGHWGLELILPVSREEKQEARINVGQQQLTVISHGNWVSKTGTKIAADCSIDPSEFVAECKIGKGKAILIADADMLQDTLLSSGILKSAQWQWTEQLIQNQMENRPTSGAF
jgi:hypothetical protein